MKFRSSFSAVVLFLFASFSLAQTSTAPTGVTFGTYAGPMGLCLNSQCNVGTLSKEEISITPNFSIGSTQLVVPAINFQGYYGHVSYALPWESVFKNTLIPAHTIQFNFHAAPGVVNNGSTTAPGTPHIGAFAGVDINYAPTSDGKFVIAGRIDGTYAPGFGGSSFGEVYTGYFGYLFGGTTSASGSGVKSAVRRVWGSKK